MLDYRSGTMGITEMIVLTTGKLEPIPFKGWALIVWADKKVKAN